ncbi:low-density lipoprotein receptor isoform X1 [Procambarus clarkii]|uniref:low-density lipoprotein receptor isoform X2 n=1 Tax=Procambarus clarkii TaxID=6728 RepID=UPI003743A6A2
MTAAACVVGILVNAVALGLVAAARGDQDQLHTLADITQIVQKNQESVVRLAATLNDILEAKRRSTCTQDVSTRELSICEVVKEGVLSTAAIFASLELSLAELNLQLLNNTCDQAQTSNCSGSEWECESGECILEKNVCDGVTHCQDGSDEPPDCVNNNCPEGEFKCDSGRSCIPNVWVCDGHTDCPDNSDENCFFTPSSPTPSTASSLSTPPSKNKCSEKEFECLSDRVCIPNMWVCDGESDCQDATDEENCSITLFSAPLLTTASSQSTLPPKAECREGTFTCRSDKRCIPVIWVCDTEADCVDGSDEENCSVTSTTVTTATPSTPPSKGPCVGDQFLCEATLTCLPSDWRCDGEVDCDDGSDETECSKDVDDCEARPCSHLCLPSPAAPAGYTCACPEGMILLRDRRTCGDDREQDMFIKFPFVN